MKIDINNFEKIIPSKMVYKILRFIPYVLILIFSSSKWFTILISVFLVWDVLNFIYIFKLFINFYLLKYKTQGNYNIQKTINIETDARLLGVDLKKDGNDVIKRRYRELTKKWHPDKFVNKSEETQETAKRNFQKLNNAYNNIKKYKNIK